MPTQPFHPIPGRIVVTGYSPDGDSIRFIPTHAKSLASLARSSLLRPDVHHSVQLRLEGADAPELHYQGVAQPLALAARDTLLRWLGFTHLRWDTHARCVMSQREREARKPRRGETKRRGESMSVGKSKPRCARFPGSRLDALSSVYYNSATGTADSFALHGMPVSGVLGADASVITLKNLNVAALDIDGDATIDLLHTPKVKTYSRIPELERFVGKFRGRVRSLRRAGVRP